MCEKKRQLYRRFYLCNLEMIALFNEPLYQVEFPAKPMSCVPRTWLSTSDLSAIPPEELTGILCAYHRNIKLVIFRFVALSAFIFGVDRC